MSLQKVIEDTNSDESLVNKPDSYSFIYKKTEKIAYAVFYITEFKKDSIKNEQLVSYTQETAKDALNSVLDVLMQEEVSDQSSLKAAKRTLMKLSSALQLCQASAIFKPDHVNLLTREVREVLQNLDRLLVNTERAEPLMLEDDAIYNTERVKKEREERAHARITRKVASHSPRPAALASQQRVGGGPEVKTDRRQRIESVLRTKGQASIKDISEEITDCSEKTIQRELNDMISQGLVLRQGERRWSKYSLVQQ